MSLFQVSKAPLEQITLVEASAGTGKTYSIKHLVLRLVVEEAISIERLLVMTFTRAATAELKRRIEEHFRETADVLLGRTLESGLIAEQITLWEEKGITRETALARVETALAELDRANILTIHSFCRQILQERSFSAGESLDGELTPNLSLLTQEVVEDFLLEEIQRAKADQVANGQAGPLAPLPGLIDENGSVIGTGAYVRLLNLLAENPPELVPWVLDVPEASPVRVFFERFLTRAPQALAERKKARSVYDYNDMVSGTWEALRGERAEAFSQAVRHDFQAVLIDEFQDTDALQLAIVERLFLRPLTGDVMSPRALHRAHPGDEDRELAIRSLIFVGDPKQAIYSFRGADLSVYLSLRNRLNDASRAVLGTNFRSAGPLVEALNAWFDPDKDPHATTPAGSPFLNEELTYQRVNAQKTHPELWRLTEGVWSPQPPVVLLADEIPQTSSEALTEAVVNQIVEYIEAGQRQALWIRVDPSKAKPLPSPLPPEAEGLTLRPVLPSDMAVLCRGNQELDTFRLALLKHGVRAQMQRRDDVCQTDEAREIRYVLQALLAQDDERALRLALATRLMGYTVADIEALNADQKSALRSVFIEARRRWERTGVASALQGLLNEFKTLERLVPTLDGDEILTNYDHLIEILHDNGRFYKTPSGLLERFEWLMTQSDESRAPRLSVNQGLVSLMTVHASKGLEFPIVFVTSLHAWTGHRTNRALAFRDRRQVNGRRERILRITFPAGEPDSAEQEEELARLLYVALTRAKSQLILSWKLQKKSLKNPLDWHMNVLKSIFWRMIGAHVGDMTPEALMGWVKRWIAATPPRALFVPPASVPPAGIVLPEHAQEATSELTLAHTPESPIPPAWRLMSFTGLSRQIREPGSFPRYHGPVAEEGEETKSDTDDAVHAFPRGALPGECLHSMFEEADFVRHSQLTPDGDRARAALAARQIDRYLALTPEARQRAIASAQAMLLHVLNAPMLPAFRLGELTPTHKMSEMEFLMHTDETVSVYGLKQILAAMGPEYALENLTGETLHGFLKGFIDLVFEHEGHYWILDWKSNHCGAQRKGDFTPEVLAKEVDKKHYRLQYLIYAVALRRYLRARLGAAFKETMIGGALYVFLRGVDKDVQPTADTVQGVLKDTHFVRYLPMLDDYLAGKRTVNEAVAFIHTLARAQKGQ
ncbi:MAG: UvrD-helicase domain-containing protein [Sutterella sp.]|nr:UvrD-helicase domain-containing protein [Sutterella sp.]